MGFSVNTSVLSFMFGPQFSSRSSGVTGFAHFLVGGTRGSAGVDLGGDLPGVSASELGFGLMVGGGLDVNVSKNLAVRIIQAEMLIRMNPLTAAYPSFAASLSR